MKILYDNHGFIWRAVTKESMIDNTNGYSEAIVSFDFGVLVDKVYRLPNYKYTNGSVSEITDVSNYNVDTEIWNRYLNKLKGEVIYLLSNRTDAELHDIYNASPQYKKDIIYTQIEEQAANAVSQVSMNLCLEVLLRVYAEKEYVERVENRVLTTDESNAVNAVLTMMHQHSFGMGMPLSMSSWWVQYLGYMLQTSDNLRMSTISRRYSITGRY